MKQEPITTNESFGISHFNTADGYDYYDIDINGEEVGQLKVLEDYRHKIKSAFTETLGKGYNPAAMEELYKGLKTAMDIIERLSDEYREVANKHSSYTNGEHNRLGTALQNAKTIKP